MGFFDKKTNHNTNEVKGEKGNKRGFWGTIWGDITFALIAAAIIRWCIFEAYNIPTGSMERSLLVNDFLFVSKIHYGMRVPNTPIAFPLVHHTFPVINTKAYSELIRIPYKRLPAIEKVNNLSSVVFNYPADEFPRPVDKKENYIKRCVAIPGDEFAMKNSHVYINGKPQIELNTMQFMYNVKFKSGKGLTEAEYDDLHINIERIGQLQDGSYIMIMMKENYYKLKEHPAVESISRFYYREGDIPTAEGAVFPKNQQKFAWNIDNIGPIKVPAKGMTITLNSDNIDLYRTCITKYEHNTLEEKDGKFIINGKETTGYTFKMDYYWMMGDNRYDSLDSRYWGFVPEDHIVGKPWFIFASFETGKGIGKFFRFGRFFNRIW